MYCENDGVDAWDPSGHDPICLQQTDGAAGFGHTAIVVQYNQKRLNVRLTGKGSLLFAGDFPFRSKSGKNIFSCGENCIVNVAHK